MADLRGWSVVVMVVVCIQMAQGCFPPPPRPKPCPGKPSETQNTTEKKHCIFPFLDADGKTEFTNCTTLEGYSNEDTYCATSLNKDCTYKDLGVCLKGGGESCSLTKSGMTICDKVCVIWKDKELKGAEIMVQRPAIDETLISCILRCSKTNKCKFWSYGNGKGICKLYESANDDKTQTTNSVSGSIGCYQDTECSIKASTYTGESIDTPGVSMEECASKCGEDENCKVWSYHIKDRVCNIKKDDGGTPTTSETHVSGNKGCAIKRDCDIIKQAQLDNIENLPPTLLGGDQEDCTRKCGSNPNCNYWKYSTNNFDCQLFKIGKNSHVLDSKDIVGTNNCALYLPRTSGNGCIIKRNSYIKDDTIDKKFQVRDMEECASKCGESEKCQFWSYHEIRRDCYLKSSNKKESSVFPEYVTGSKGCALKMNIEDCDIIGPGETKLINKYLELLSFQFIPVDQDDCARECGSHQECVYWNYSPKKNECKLYKPGQKILGKLENDEVLGSKGCALKLNLPQESYQCYGKNGNQDYWGPKKLLFYTLEKRTSQTITWKKRCTVGKGIFNKENTLPASQQNLMAEQLAKVAIMVLDALVVNGDNDNCDNKMTATIALARATKNEKKILILAGNIKEKFDENKMTKKRRVMYAIKKEFDGTFNEVHFLHPKIVTYEANTGISHHHAEMQIAKYAKFKQIEIKDLGVSKTPCCACNTILRPSYIDGFLVAEENDNKYHEMFEKVSIASGHGQAHCDKTSPDVIGKRCGSQFQLENWKDFKSYWEHPGTWKPGSGFNSEHERMDVEPTP